MKGGKCVFANVIVDIVHENVAHTFTSRIPDQISVQPGQRVSVPFGYQQKEGVVLSLAETTGLPPEKVKSITSTLEDYPAVLPNLVELAMEMAEENHCPLAETIRLMMPAEMRGGRVRVRTQPVVRLNVGPERFEEAMAQQKRSARRQMILSFLQDGKKHPVAEIREEMNAPLPDIRRLVADGWVTLTEEEFLRQPGGPIHAERACEPELTELQKETLHEVLPSLARGEGKFLLHGVTGSGKTEVFIRMVREVLKSGRGAIILVPEIALTPQMVDWFRARFGEGSAVLHSRLSAGERFDEWRRIRRGDARVVIGARSAVFAPVEDLGLIVIDEEHEATYLSDRHPRYDARDVAASRCRREGATLLLASATPSVISFQKTRQGEYQLLDMPERVGSRPLPEVTVVDMRRELNEGNRSIFSRPLTAALNECLRKKQQAMLLMNHRGYHSFVSCRSCGHVVKCPNCDVALTYHVGGTARLHCHYCGHTEEPPSKCPECGSERIRYFGAGTQQVEAELTKQFPGIRTLRMDMDTTSGKDGHAKILEAFRAGEADVLVGTQMIAKGLDFPAVTVVGVIAADMTLNLPDYRARERTFQLLTQVAGRAGRGSEKGQVVIQTYKPEDAVIRAAARQDYRGFFEEELERRRVALYPPFTVMARLLVESADGDAARRHVEVLCHRCEQLLQEEPAFQEACILMHMEQPPMAMLRGKSRYQLLFKLHVRPETERFAAALSDMSREEIPGLDIYFEYNPATMM